MTDNEIAKNIAKTIISQIGMDNLVIAGWHKAAYLPAYKDGIRGGVTALIGDHGSEQYHRVTIRLTVLDLYDIEITTLDGEPVKDYLGAYADQIGELIADASYVPHENYIKA
jgi:hypothetical protein